LPKAKFQRLLVVTKVDSVLLIVGYGSNVKRIRYDNNLWEPHNSQAPLNSEEGILALETLQLVFPPRTRRD
jgi:hypothetical protein